MMGRIYIALLLCLMIVFGCNTQKNEVTTKIYQGQESSIISITSEVGKGMQHEICNLPPEEIQKVILTGFSTLATLEYTSSQDCITVSIPKQRTETQGVFQIEAITHSRVYTLVQLNLQAKAPSGKMESFTGPKSILRSDIPGTMMTAFPRDEFGNATQAYDEFVFQSLKNKVATITALTPKSRYSSLTLDAGTNRKILLAGQADQASSIRHHVKVLTECPKEIEITTTDLYPIADGKQFFRVFTNVLFDRLGNLVENGTEVQFLLADHKGGSRGVYNSMVVNGKAESWIQNPIEGGSYQLYASICGKRSHILFISFESTIDNIAYEWSNHNLVIGPLTGPLGQALDNGTMIHASFEVGSKKQYLSRQLRSGFAIFDLRTLWTDAHLTTASIEIHGKTFKVQREAI